MKRLSCKNCGHEFPYDEDSGLNVAYKRGSAPGKVRLLPGLLPLCPKCGLFNTRVEDESTETVTYTTYISVPTMQLPEELEPLLVAMMVEMIDQTAQQKATQLPDKRVKLLTGSESLL